MISTIPRLRTLAPYSKPFVGI